MFQIAAATALAEELGTEAVFDLNSCHTPAQGFTSNKYKDNLFKNLKDESLTNVKFSGVYTETKFSYSELPKQDNIILNGYFQSEKYFSKYFDYIRDKVFHISEEKQEEIDDYLVNLVGEEGSITGVHVRRGDYMNLTDFHTPCSIEYYQEAMKIIGEGHFIFISDDMEWCKETFKGENIHYSDFTNEIDDFYLMMGCNNHIIANSSFSWWGAYLSDWDNKVVAPKKWFGPKGPQDQQDVIPNNWIKI
jgi:hypothetical protein